MSNRLDPDQAKNIVRLDLGHNYLQRLSVDDNSKQNQSGHCFWNGELEIAVICTGAHADVWWLQNFAYP